MKTINFLLALTFVQYLLFAQGKGNADFCPASKPVFRVDYRFPTADKPQSKLWYMDNCWWALLPKSSGPSLWQRTDHGWVEHSEINQALNGIPGRADVWADENRITAVGVDKHLLVVFRVEKSKNESGKKWVSEWLTTLVPPSEDDEIETATIVQDHTGRWLVAADAGDKICVWNSPDGRGKWEGPYILNQGVSEDDICTIAVIPGGVGVMWSDQVHEAVRIRIHQDDQPDEKWEEVTTIDAGNKTADDHLNTAVTADGTLWLVAKNSVDRVGKPQFVLRVRSPQGKWTNYPYCNLDSVKHPSRPVIIATESDPPLLLSGHTLYNQANPYLGEIVFGVADTTKSGILEHLIPVIVPDTTGWIGSNLINDVTGPKKPFPQNAPWIVLASDKNGSVYEADLSFWFKQR